MGKCDFIAIYAAEFVMIHAKKTAKGEENVIFFTII